jgi:hypothetical protein
MNQKYALDVSSPAGYETGEVSAAKNAAYDVIEDALSLVCDYHDVDAHPEGFPDGSDPIDVADAVVARLIEMGWRPTEAAS